MNKTEVLALGVPEEKYSQFQLLYNRDLRKRAETLAAESGGELQTRSAINAMLKLIKRPETLESILRYINTAYYREG